MPLLRRGESSCALVALALALAACHRSSPPDRFAALADAVERERLALGVPGVAVAVVEGGEVTFARGFGTRAPGGGHGPVTPTTLFRIGSITKMLTAIAVLQRVQRGDVSLDAPVVDYVPGLHFSRDSSGLAQAITVRQLLDHTSGIAEYLEVDAPPGEREDGALARFLTGRFADVGYVQYAPGALWSYSNPNFMLAGRVAEAVSGVSYRELMRASVLGPLGMDRTLFLPEEVVADGDYALGLSCAAGESGCASPSPDPVVTPTTYDNPWARPAGYAWSSVLDLAKLAGFLVHGADHVLARDQRSAMLTAQVNTHELGDLVGYGYGVVVNQGLFLGPFYRTKVLAHEGALPGYHASIVCAPELVLCLVTLANGDAGSFPSSLVTALTTLAHLPAPSEPPELAPDSARFPAYAGDYVDPYGIGTVRVTASADGVFVSVPSLDEAGTPYGPELTPTTLDGFLMQVAGEPRSVTFVTDERGVYRYLRSEGVVAVRPPEADARLLHLPASTNE